MSVLGNSQGNNGGRMYSFGAQPSLIDCNFIVDSSTVSGIGANSLKGQGVQKVLMASTAGAPSGTPALGVARSYGVLAASAITNTGASVVTGNLGEYPGTAVTGFPPGSVTGVSNVSNVAAQQAQAAALAAYTDMQARSATTIATALDSQTLVPGVYSSAGGTFTLAQSGGGTLTLNGAGVYVFKMATTLTTGAGGVPVITLSGGARAQDVYWVVGSSATINSGNAGTFQGNIIALTSITDTLGGTVNGSLIALNGAVTISAAAAVNAKALASNSSPSLGLAWIQLSSNYNQYLGGFNGEESPLSGSAINIAGSNLVVGNPYVISSVGAGPAGTVTIAPVADSAGSLASKYFMLYDSYGNSFAIYCVVSGVGQAPLLGAPAPVGQAGLKYVQLPFASGASAATIGAALVLVINNLPSGVQGVFSFTSSGTTTVTAVSTALRPVAGVPQDGSVVIPASGPAVPIIFTVTSASATAGAIYTDGSGDLYQVSVTLVAGTTLQTSGVGVPQGALLTKVSGTGDATIAFSAAVTGWATAFSFAMTVSDTNLQDWNAVGVPKGIDPAVGVSFVASAVGAGASTGQVKVPSVSGINSMEVIGNPNLSLAPHSQGGSPNVGGWILVQMLSNGVRSAPVDGSLVFMSFYVDARLSPSNVNGR